MTTRQFKAMAHTGDVASLKLKQDEVFDRLKAAEKQSVAAIVAPEEVQEKATAELLDAISLCEEFGALGLEC